MIGYGILVPAGVAAGVAWLLQRLFNGSTGRYLSAAGLCCGFLAGYSLAVDGSWIPERNWHWLPYLALGAAIAGPIAIVDGSSITRRRTLLQLFPYTAAAALVPSWTPPEIQIPCLTAFLLLAILLFDPLPRHLAPRSLLPLLYLSALATAAFLAARISLTYGQLASLTAAAFAGNSIVFWCRGDRSAIRGLLPAYVVLLVGTAYVGCIYPADPIYGLLITPVTPLVLWASVRGPLSQLQGIRRSVSEYALVVLVLIGNAVVLFSGSVSGNASGW